MDKGKPEMQLNLMQSHIDNTVSRESIPLSKEQADKVSSFIGGSVFEQGNFSMWLTASINNQEVAQEQVYSFKKGDLFTVNINGVEKKFIIEPSETEWHTPIIKGASIDGAEYLEIQHAKKAI